MYGRALTSLWVWCVREWVSACVVLVMFEYMKTLYTKDSFYTATKAVWKACAVPTREPDYVSYSSRTGEVSSRYWYSERGVIRQSDHWSFVRRTSANAGIKDWAGEIIPKYNPRKCERSASYLKECTRVASCFWVLSNTTDRFTDCGYCSWESFKPNKRVR